MTIISAPLALLFLTPFVASLVASQGQNPIDPSACVTNFDANADYFPSKVTVNDATLFKVDYKGNYKVVTNSAAGVNMVYVLTQCGTPPPAASLFGNNTVFVNIPVVNAASIATTAVVFIEMLGKRSALKAVDTEALVSSPCVQYDLEHQSITALEDTNQTLRAEQFQSVDVVFSSFGSDPNTENKTIITSEVSDPGPLNRAEWLEFYSAFFNLEDFAQNLTAIINNNYNCFKNAAASNSTKPIIAWTSYAAPDSYNNNTASWSISGAAYKKILSTDAGATFYNGTTASTFSNAADFQAALKNVDVVIDETMVGGYDMSSFLQNYQLAADADFKFLKNKAVFREDGTVNPNDGRDWFSSAVVVDDAVLQDVIRAVHPGVLPANVHYNWIRNIAKDEPRQTLTSANCTATDSNKPVPDRAVTCSTMKVTSDNGNAASKTTVGALSAILGLFAIALAL
ncbi:hypothetical protein BGX26_012079 [Mortierella sp. AD094]|nr:hypothetical protein BGX26_012079 [Mortierella sp. AD094]